MTVSTRYQPKNLIRVSEFRLAGNEHKYVLDCLTSRWLTQGKYVRQLEERFAELAGVRYALACSSGTAALHLAAKVLNLWGDFVGVSAFTYIATANAVTYTDAQPYFIDVDEKSWCVTRKSQLTHNLSEDVPAVFTTDIYDAHSDCEHDFLVLDAAHIDPVTYHLYCKVRNLLPDIACFSFFASKIIACGEGGMFVTDNEHYYNLARLYRGQGATIPGEYHHSVIGYNYRMTDLQAGIALAQLEDLPNTLAYRRHIIDRYRENLANSSITLQGGERASGWMMAVLLPNEYVQGYDWGNKLSDELAVDYVRKRLLKGNIETRPFFVPLCDTEAYAFMGQSGSCPVAANLYSRGICLPTHLGLDDEDVDYICEGLLEEVKW